MNKRSDRVVFRVLPMLVFLLHCRSGFGQSTKAFENAISQVRESRDAIASYCVRIDGTELADVEVSVKDKDSKEKRAKYRSFRTVTIEIACDRANDRFVAICTSWPTTAGTSVLSNEENLFADMSSEIYLVDGLDIKRYSFGKFHYLSSLTSVRVPDPLSIGLGFCPEITSHYPMEKLLVALSSWNSTKNPLIVSQKGPVLQFHRPHHRNPSENILSVTFNTQQDYCPVAIEMSVATPGADVDRHVDGHIENRKVAGHWLPHFASYKCNEVVCRTFEFEWFSINEPLPDDLFDPVVLATLIESPEP